MDLTMVPNDGELAELRKMLVGVASVEEAKPERRTGLTARLSLRKPTSTVRENSGDLRIPTSRLRIDLARTSNPA